MAGYSGRTAWVGASGQAVKGTPAARVRLKSAMTGGTAQPDRVVETLSETDSDRARGSAYLQRVGASGAPELYVRDDSIALFAYGALGSVVSTSTPPDPNNTHTITPATTLPYMTFWRMIGNALWEQYPDCLVSSFSVRVEAGQPLVATVGFQGRSSVRLTAEPDSVAGASVTITGNTAVADTVITTTTPHDLFAGDKIVITGSNSTPSINGTYYVRTAPTTTTLTILGPPTPVTVAGTAGTIVKQPVTPSVASPLYFHQGTITVGGGATSLVSSMEYTLENNAQQQLTNSITPFDVTTGGLDISLAFNMIFNDLDEYNKFHYGTTTGTVQTPTINSGATSFLFAAGANNSVEFQIADFAYEEFPVEPNPDGAPIVVAARGVAQRVVGAETTIIVKNQRSSALFGLL